MIMVWNIIIGAVVTIVIILLLYFVFLKKQTKDLFKNIANEVLTDKSNYILNLAKTELGEKKDEIKSIIEKIETELERHRQTYTELKGKLETHEKITDELKTSTSKLTQILSNSRLRGQRGEKIVEDILKVAGFIEGTHYLKQKQQETVSTKPDFTFLLPNGYKVNLDAKFPFDNWIKIKEADNLEDKQKMDYYKKQFENDVKDKIKQVISRDYINPNENTVDYVMLFIPSEGIASFIHEFLPNIFDLALSSKVVLVSPYQLFGYVSIIKQAFQNFFYNERIEIVLGLMEEFANRYNLFKKRFLDIGDKIEKVESVYEDVKTKSFKTIDSTVKKIEKHKSGHSFKEIEEQDDFEPKLLDKPEEE